MPALRTYNEVAYRVALRRVWELMALGPNAGPEECRQALAEVVRLIDEVGPSAALAIRRREELAWHRKTGACPRCGEPGPLHQ